MNEEQMGLHNEFIRKAVSVGFTDDQAYFMWEYIMETIASMARMIQE